MGSATTDRRMGLAGNTAYKAAATALASANIVLSGEQTVGGVAVKAVNAAGVPDRVLCVGQTDATTNGLWDVGTGTMEQNGTYDMMGNVWEWNETLIDGSCRGVRGGSFIGSDNLVSSGRNSNYPSNEGFSVGFRVASVPEPCSLALLLIGGLVLRNRKR